MRVLFLTLLDFHSFDDRNIYTDLLREFIKNGHDVYCISPAERRTGIRTHMEENGHLLKLKIGNTQKTNVIEKGISTLMIEPQFISAIKNHFSNVKFDLVLYSTPPITLAGVVQYIRKRDGAKTYLMLKDIFPQNAVDLGMLSLRGWKSVLYRYFRHKEKVLYALSDCIGCMSEANMDYILEQNPEISKGKVEVCPNAVEPLDMALPEEEIAQMRLKYDIPLDKRVFVYGGNLGKPQDVPFIVNCLKKCADLEETYFVIAGSGTDRHFLEEYIAEEKPSHVKLFEQLPKDEYDKMIACCDVGLVFLDHRFTIPNFPSRLLSYMQAGLPVLACTDPNTDIGKVITEGGFGWWCESNDVRNFVEVIERTKTISARALGAFSFDYLNKNYSVQQVYAIIAKNKLLRSQGEFTDEYFMLDGTVPGKL